MNSTSSGVEAQQDADAAPAGRPAAAAGAPAPPTGRRFDRSLIEGPLGRAVWKLAWPTMLTNMIGGLQGIIDHALVGHLVGFRGNAAIGVSLQIYLVVIVFINSLFIGMSVLVARFAGAGDSARVDRTVYQAFLAAMGVSLFVLAPLGWALAPSLLELINAAPEVRAEALPFLRITFLFGSGTLLFYMISGALRAAGDARRPMHLGIALTVLNIAFNIVLIRGLGPIPAFGTAGSAMGTALATLVVAAWAMAGIVRGRWVVSFPRGAALRPDWEVIRTLFRFGLPSGIQGVAMNIGGVLLLAFIGSLAASASAQAAYAVGYSQLFSLVTWTALGLMSAAAVVAGQNLGAGRPERSVAGVHTAARIGLAGAVGFGLLFFLVPDRLLALFGIADPTTVALGTQLLRTLALSGLFVTTALTYTGGLQGAGDTRSPLFISIASQLVVPLGICLVLQQTRGLRPLDVWLAILAGHATRCALSVWRFRQGRWRHIRVDLGAG